MSDKQMEKVEKKPVGKRWGGQFLLNPQWQAVLDKYIPQGMIMEYFFGLEGASKDPRYDFLNNPNYFQQMSLLQAEQQAQMAAQQPQQPPGEGGDGDGGDGGGDDSGGGDDGGGGEQDAGSQPQQGGDDAKAPADAAPDLTRSLDQLAGLMSKSEAQLPSGKRKLLAQQRKFIQKTIQIMEHESKDALKEILDVAEAHAPKKKG